MTGFMRGLGVRRRARRFVLPVAVAATVLAGNSMSPPDDVVTPAVTGVHRVARVDVHVHGAPVSRFDEPGADRRNAAN